MNRTPPSERTPGPSISSGSWRVAILLAIAGLSGIAGLGYEILWTRLLAVILGHEIGAVLSVLVAFFGGLALGAVSFGARVARSPRPHRWYAGFEFLIAAWALVLIALYPTLAERVGRWLPIDTSPVHLWLGAFAIAFLMLAPATVAMGGTLPALDALLKRRIAGGRAVGPVYAANTLGAVAGTLLTTFWLIPAIGMSRGLALFALLNVVCALLILSLGSKQMRAEASGGGRSDRPTDARATPNPLAWLFVTGLAGIGYEVVAIRTLAQLLENTVYTFAALLSVYLVGTAIGAALARADRAARHGRVGLLAAITALACLLGGIALGHADAIMALAQEAVAPDMAGRIFVEFALAAAVFALPTLGMGALFAVLAQAARDRHQALGGALAINTLGAAIAPALFGTLALPWLGARATVAIIALLYLLPLAGLARREQLRAMAVAAGAVALFVAGPSLRFVETPAGGSVVWHRDGVMAAVSVVRDAAGDTHLQVNSHFRMGGTASIRSDHREAHIPLLLHPDPKTALFLGLGTGATASAAADHPGLSVDIAELVPEVAEAVPHFAKAAPNFTGQSPIRIQIADARRFVRASERRYDVIVADLFHPSVDGAGGLYAREHFAAIRDRLAPGGLFCQWLPLHQLDLATLRVIMRTFLAVFPDGRATLAQFSTGTPLIGLIGGAGDRRYPADWLTSRVRDAHLKARLDAVDLHGDLAVFGLFLGGTDQLAAFAGLGPINTDDRPIVTFEAPRTAYAPGDTPGQRIVAVLSGFHPTPDEILTPGAVDAEGARLVAYWQARDRFVALGATTPLDLPPRELISRLARPLVDIVATSPDFDAAYNPVLAMAARLARVDGAAARQLLYALDRAAPTRPEARRMLALMPSG